jgi:RimJ/RimL family protein N-acetyltransferase/uncharacterized protein YndB with AHSA1/START domain
MIASSPLGPTLETARLILRPPVRADFEGLCAFHADPETMRHLGGVQSPAQVWRTMCMMAGAWHLEGFHMFSVLNKETGEWMGRIGPLYPHGWPAREVGWGLMARHWGKGYAREAAAAAMDYVFDVLGWDRVVHTIAPDNLASAGVAKSLGSYDQGPGQLPDPYANVPVNIWGQTREEWQVNRMRPTTGFTGIEVVNERVIGHTPDRVRDAFADPQKLAQWWGPHGFTNTIEAFDLRPGGVFRLTMRNELGQDFPNEKSFREVSAHRIVIEHHRPVHHFLLTMTFDAERSGTRLGWRMQFAPSEHIDDLGGELAHFLHAANEQNFDRLEDFLSR